MTIIMGSTINLLRDPNTSLIGARNHVLFVHSGIFGSVLLVFGSLTTINRGALMFVVVAERAF